ncbi:hypothetical protein TYRP_021813 [Tyrophagus putrescentiae]|nr:hypothetical protein TYRP_021813 [Tyrophagus putrescentiae]
MAAVRLLLRREGLSEEEEGASPSLVGTFLGVGFGRRTDRSRGMMRFRFLRFFGCLGAAEAAATVGAVFFSLALATVTFPAVTSDRVSRRFGHVREQKVIIVIVVIVADLLIVGAVLAAQRDALLFRALILREASSVAALEEVSHRLQLLDVLLLQVGGHLVGGRLVEEGDRAVGGETGRRHLLAQVELRRRRIGGRRSVVEENQRRVVVLGSSLIEEENKSKTG